ncbi:unnamed protein product [Peniophora sp. CBMAI 1063]|nr:unnamed protein product [Peniophora sp. CBMAI 1063]
MAYCEGKEDFEESGPHEAEGDGLWNVFLQTMRVERDEVVRHGKAAMNEILLFSTVFTATVAMFLVDSQHSLSLSDSNVRETGATARTNALLEQLVLSTNTTPVPEVERGSFRPTDTAMVVNTLWCLSLVTSLLSALLAMMIQEWLRDSVRKETRLAMGTIEQYGLKRLRVYTSLERYGLDRLATFLGGMTQLAVALFLVGLSLSLFPAHSTPALAVVALSGMASVFYIIASLMPFIDSRSPYYTPLSFVLFAVTYNSMMLITCSLMYLVSVCAAVRSWISKKHITLQDLDPRHVGVFLEDPVRSAQLLLPILVWIIRSRSAEELDRLISRTFEPPQRPQAIEGKEMGFLSTRAHQHLLKCPSALRYLSRRLLCLRYQGVANFFVGLRNSSIVMTQLVGLFCDVDSVLAALGSIRFLQMLLSAETYADNQSQTHTNQDFRWVYMGPILEVFPSFARRLGELNAEALRQQDVALHAAIASFRWTLIQALGSIQGHPCAPDQPGFVARTNIRFMFAALNAVETLRLHTVLSNDHEDLEDLFLDKSNDPRFELGSRTALTLLEGVKLCDWRPSVDWEKPESNYLRRGTPGMWEWRRLYDPKGVGPKPFASTSLRDLFSQESVQVSMRAMALGSTLPDGRGISLAAINALRDLASIADFSRLE